MTKKVILIWFRNDLRIHDNEILFEAVERGDIVIPVYFFDPRYFKTHTGGFRNTGVVRANFLRETVVAFKESLQNMGADLLVFYAKPEDILGTLCAKYDVTEVYHHREVAQRETKISELVEVALWKEKINLKHFIGHTLYHKEDLPIPIKDIPDSFSAFKKKVEKESFVRPVLPPISTITTHPHLEETTVPSLEDLGFSNDDLAGLLTAESTLRGGEKHAIDIIDTTLSPDYDESDDYNLVSPYIAHGAISPAFYYHKIKASGNLLNKKRYDRLISRLLWRDYFRFMLKKYPNVFFKNHTPEIDVLESVEKIQRLVRNGANDPIIQNLLQQLLSDGNLAYEHREILAAYLLQELDINHLAGAQFFEEYSIDYAPATTYGYWLHSAGFGTSAKDNLKADWRELCKKSYRLRPAVKLPSSS